MNKYLVFIFNVFNAYCNVTENWEVCNDKNLQDACKEAFNLPSVNKISVNIDLSCKGECEKVSRGKVSLKSNITGGFGSVEYFLLNIDELFKYLIAYGADEEKSIIKFYACVLEKKGNGDKLTIGEFYSDDAYERVDGYFYVFPKNLRKRVFEEDEGVILFESAFFNTFRNCVDTEYVFTSSDLKVEIVSYDDYKKQLDDIHKAIMERLKPLEGPKNIDHKSIPPVHSTATFPVVPRTSGSSKSSSGGVKTNDSCCHSCK